MRPASQCPSIPAAGESGRKMQLKAPNPHRPGPLRGHSVNAVPAGPSLCKVPAHYSVTQSFLPFYSHAPCLYCLPSNMTSLVAVNFLHVSAGVPQPGMLEAQRTLLQPYLLKRSKARFLFIQAKVAVICFTSSFMSSEPHTCATVWSSLPGPIFYPLLS